jgi:leucyl aminopeptidase
MSADFIAPDSPDARPVHAVHAAQAAAFLAERGGAVEAWAREQEFTGQAGRVLLVPGADGMPERAVFGLGDGSDPMMWGWLATRLAPGDWYLAPPSAPADATVALTAFGLGAYRFTRYKAREARPVRLVAPPGADAATAARLVSAISAGRDLVNTPPNDMGPDALEAAAREVAIRVGAQVEVIAGEALLAQNYPLIHAVGKAAAEPPRLVILRKAREGAPKLALVGKGVTFDSGGLNIKPGSGMALMKKDMGGAACALTLFRLACEAGLRADISLYLPIVENAISGPAFRPGDIYPSRKGLTVEIDNTDAEGRLILADALTRASEDGAGLVIDLATLTGAARVALGPDLPPFYTSDDALAADIQAASVAVGEPVWRMPLWAPYRDDLDSPVADMKNSGGAFAGSVTAALFLQRFVDAPSWVHFDVYCWTPKDRAGRPQGGDVHAVRLLERMLRDRYGALPA